VKFGIVGLGRMGLNHVRILSLLKGVDIKFVCDADANTAGRVAQSIGARAVSSVEGMFDGIDALVIASPTVTHAEYVRRAAEAVRNIFVEKPMADSLDEALQLERLAEEKALNLQVGFIERFNPAVQQLKKVLDDSEQVVNVDFTRTNKISSRITDVDVILDLMIHDLDLALHLNGPVVAVSANGVASDGMIEFASAVLTHADGRFSRVLASRVTEKKMRTIQATCRDMFIDCDLLRKEIHISRQTKVIQPEGEPYTITALDETLEVRPLEALLAEMQAFLESCVNKAGPELPGAGEPV
jgi:predicted dehydrogenase